MSRGGDLANVERVRAHLSDKLAKKAVGALTKTDLTTWRDGLIKAELKPASVNRTMTALRAALNLAAEDADGRITNREAWRSGLKAIGGAGKARNVILDEQDVRTVIGAAYRDSDEFGLLVELAAVTGARTSQLTRLQGEDVQAGFVDPKIRKRQPRLLMPVSRKGRGEKKVTHRPVPIPESLAERLKGRTGTLLKRPDGETWAKINISRRFDEAIKGVTLGQPKVTLYALRHTSIVRQLLAGVPIRVVAALHDTSPDDDRAELQRAHRRPCRRARPPDAVGNDGGSHHAASIEHEGARQKRSSRSSGMTRSGPARLLKQPHGA